MLLHPLQPVLTDWIMSCAFNRSPLAASLCYRHSMRPNARMRRPKRRIMSCAFDFSHAASLCRQSAPPTRRRAPPEAARRHAFNRSPLAACRASRHELRSHRCPLVVSFCCHHSAPPSARERRPRRRTIMSCAFDRSPHAASLRCRHFASKPHARPPEATRRHGLHISSQPSRG